MTDFDSVKKSVKTAFDRASEAYKYELDRDQLLCFDEARERGDKVFHPQDRITHEFYQKRAQTNIGGNRDAALAAIDAAIAQCEYEMTNAPSADAASYCASIAGRTDLTADEVNAALTRYHDHTTQKAIIAAAKRSGHVFGIRAEDSMTDAERDIERLKEYRDNTESCFSRIGKSSSSAAGAMYLLDMLG